MERPTHALPALRVADHCRALIDPRQILQRACLARVFRRGDKLLTNAVIDVLLKARLLLRHCAQAGATTPRVSFLQALAMGTPTMAHGLNLRAVVGCPVICGGDPSHPQVYADVAGWLIRCGRKAVLRQVEIPHTLTLYEIGPADQPARLQEHSALALTGQEAAGDAPLDGVERYAVKGQQAIGPRVVAHGSGRRERRAARLASAEAALLPRGLERLHGLGTGAHGQLRAQTIVSARLSIDAVMGRVSVGDAVVPTDTGDPRRRRVEPARGPDQRRDDGPHVEFDRHGPYEFFTYQNTIPREAVVCEKRAGLKPQRVKLLSSTAKARGFHGLIL